MTDACPVCGCPLLKIGQNLFKCVYCGQYINPIKRLPPKFKVVSSLDKITAVEAGMQASGGLSADMVTFIHRLSERLAPTKGLDSQARGRALNVQKQFERELTNVFLGNEDFQKWYAKTATKLGLHDYNFMTMLHECLEGLKSSEAEELRQQYAQAITRMRGIT